MICLNRSYLARRINIVYSMFVVLVSCLSEQNNVLHIILFSVFGEMHLENDDYTLCVACLTPHDITIKNTVCGMPRICPDCDYDALIT